ncbi:alkaline phosphatase D family protein [Henriciella sp. AS95]|uniref:alkaline phosphatase D family protein n=1 Tax=Henriciella sp. AS95 TaxID=3135782 RepID=UPI00317333D9
MIAGLGGGYVLLGSCTSTSRPADIDAEFLHGVASGDPTPTAIVIWTRVSSPGVEAITVEFEVALDAAFQDIIRSGKTLTSAARDFTVKVDVTSLSPGTRYFYRFRAGSIRSATGRTRTLPKASARKVRLAVASCANYGSGFYNAYRAIAEQDDLDAIVHLGDYIYEYGIDGYDGETGRALGRLVDPPHETITLDDYRKRFACYRKDTDLQAAHAAAPFISVWDDHETANNSWMGGAGNHDADAEGSWERRRDAALQVYFEWMPMRDPRPGEAFRSLARTYEFGKVVSLHLIESRLTGRDQPLSLSAIAASAEAPNAVLSDPGRTMLGLRQEKWLEHEFSASVSNGIAWQLLGNQTVMSPMLTPDYLQILPDDILDPILAADGYAANWVRRSALGLPVNLDSWDGYPAARARLLSSAIKANANLVVLSGDSHMFWANDLFREPDNMFAGVEFATGSITSPGGYQSLSPDERIFGIAASATVEKNEGVRAANVRDKGFVLLEVTEGSVEARYVRVNTIAARDFQAETFLIARTERDIEGRLSTLTIAQDSQSR